MPALRIAIATLAVLGIAACAPSEEEFPAAYGKTVCAKLQKCDRADYENAYVDKDSCVDDWAAGAELILDIGDLFGAVYSPALAADCLASIRQASCGEFDDGQYDCEVFESTDQAR